MAPANAHIKTAKFKKSAIVCAFAHSPAGQNTPHFRSQASRESARPPRKIVAEKTPL
jgi:hypothetical protein